MESMKIAITGASGFIGSNLVRHFEKKHEVYAVVHIKNSWRLRDVKSQTFKLDITDKVHVRNTFNKIKPDAVLHCAAYGINYWERDVKKIIETNVIGTLNVIDACSDVSIFVNAGSCFEYGIQKSQIGESALVAPETPYAMSKALSTSLMQSSSKVKTITLRIFTAYGYYESKYRLIPYLIYSTLSRKVAKLSNKNNVRDFIFIEDILSAYEAVLKNHSKLESGMIFNVGYGKQFSVGEVARMIGVSTEWAQNLRPKEPKRVWQADISKIKKVLGWYPRYPLPKGIIKTRNWISKNMELYDTKIQEVHNR